MAKVPETGTEKTIEQIAADFPTWRIWVSRGTDGKPGVPMATRRGRDLTTHELKCGLAITLPMGYRGDLREQLADQARREEAIGYKP